ncbi:MAG: hemerythrin domain-containing protein [Betaproteobacteria bacterium]|nr:hemerythrin domain-containing protein [Betaproteobacteria bacterium]
MKAIGIIHDEHRSLAAVLHGMLYLVRDIRERGSAPNFDLLSAMVYYIDAFPERYHHPKEDGYLFRLLRKRHPAAAPVLDHLERQHKEGAAKIRDLEQALARYREGGAAGFPGFAAAVSDYADFHWDHMRTEEETVIPMARERLTPEDWKEIDAAFTDHGDPLFGAKAEAEYDSLFRRIVNLAPPPIGVGPAPAT